MPDKMTLQEAIYLVLEIAELERKHAKQGSIIKGDRAKMAITYLKEFLGDYYVNERYVKWNHIY